MEEILFGLLFTVDNKHVFDYSTYSKNISMFLIHLQYKIAPRSM